MEPSSSNPSEEPLTPDPEEVEGALDEPNPSAEDNRLPSEDEDENYEGEGEDDDDEEEEADVAEDPILQAIFGDSSEDEFEEEFLKYWSQDPKTMPPPPPTVGVRLANKLEGKGRDVESQTGQMDEDEGSFGDGSTVILSDKPPSPPPQKEEEGDEEDGDDGKIKLNDVFNILIPEEITSLIFKRLSLKDLKNARFVSKQWTALIDPLVTFSPYLFDLGITELEVFAGKGYDIKQLNVSILLSYPYPEVVEEDDVISLFSGKIQSLRFLPYTCRLGCPDGIQNRLGISHQNLVNLMKDMKSKGVETLGLHSLSFRDVLIPSPFSSCKLKDLTELNISAMDHDGPGFAVCLDSLKNTFPVLKKLKLSMMYDLGGILDRPPFYGEIYGFIGRHVRTLSEVDVAFTNLKDAHSVALLTLDHRIPHRTFTKIKTHLAKASLRELSLHVSCFEGRERFVFAQTLMDTQSVLSTLCIDNLDRWNRAIFPNIQAVISRCAVTLKKVKIRGCLCGFQDTFNSSTIQNCNNLEHLTVAVCGVIFDSLSTLPRQLQFLDLGKELSVEAIETIIARMKGLKTWALIQGRNPENPNPGPPPIPLELFKTIITQLPLLETLYLLKSKTLQPNPDLPQIMTTITETAGIGWAKCEKDFEPKSTFLVNVDRAEFRGFENE